MAYAALEESVRLLEGLDAPASALHLSRRIRHLPIAMDRVDDVAATMFLRRGVSGEPWIDMHSLARGEGGWRLLGGGSGTADDSLLTDGREAADAAGFARNLGGGGTVLNADRLMPWGAKWVRWAKLRLAVEVARLQVGDRPVPVAPHGLAVIVCARGNLHESWRSIRTDKSSVRYGYGIGSGTSRGLGDRPLCVVSRDAAPGGTRRAR